MTQAMNRRTLLFSAVGLVMLGTAGAASAADLPKVAVTDLTYEEKVASWFNYYESHSSGGYAGGFGGGAGGSQNSTVAMSGEIIRIERGELHKFTGDIRGALIKSGGFKVIQGKPWNQPETATLFDVIERIKRGFYPGADYVLFGTITNVESRNDAINIQNTNATNFVLSMELVCDFSLINTKTYEVAAGFTAMGEGQDSRLVNTAGTRITLSRGRVMKDVSASLAENVLNEVNTQFSQGQPQGGAAAKPAATDGNAEGKTVIFR